MEQSLTMQEKQMRQQHSIQEKQMQLETQHIEEWKEELTPDQLDMLNQKTVQQNPIMPKKRGKALGFLKKKVKGFFVEEYEV